MWKVYNYLPADRIFPVEIESVKLELLDEVDHVRDEPAPRAGIVDQPEERIFRFPNLTYPNITYKKSLFFSIITNHLFKKTYPFWLYT